MICGSATSVATANMYPVVRTKRIYSATPVPTRAENSSSEHRRLRSFPVESLGRKKRTCSSAAARSSLLGVPILESCSSEATCAMARRSRERYLRRCRAVVARVSRTDPKSDMLMSISGSESAVDVRSRMLRGIRAEVAIAIRLATVGRLRAGEGLGGAARRAAAWPQRRARRRASSRGAATRARPPCRRVASRACPPSRCEPLARETASAACAAGEAAAAFGSLLGIRRVSAVVLPTRCVGWRRGTSAVPLRRCAALLLRR
mmetsp:Transcript_48064/g.160166  ORF Transcript_48064/g.160166 Transcript_48064/m.160166 type:complete len:262 (-) Transcript_48064:19-804(-)